ncbi:hypothetical protein VNO77_03604 [Canavalia gladiata]|uniref:Uncharacterized protein n=1 Tax=Canavalia gladiata TaxID=3824 RepID=A0AAN9R426_CANGL
MRGSCKNSPSCAPLKLAVDSQGKSVWYSYNLASIDHENVETEYALPSSSTALHEYCAIGPMEMHVMIWGAKLCPINYQRLSLHKQRLAPFAKHILTEGLVIVPEHPLGARYSRGKHVLRLSNTSVFKKLALTPDSGVPLNTQD